ncbi:MAG TPA: helix-turn-helix transcriptional regulator [Gaiellaceae bacterium]|nr:helix-turn-helix transcriptional regulator [Gaiellaceae bacterium]
MDTRNEIREFLTSRRARIAPEEAGLRTYGTGPRRVPGLRREEVALLAGVSVDYYTRLERGNLGGASDSVLEAVARALHLDEPERAHLFNLARAQIATGRPRRRSSPTRVRATVRQMLDSITAPAYVRNGRMDILAASRLGHALYAQVFEMPRQPPNSARFAFLDPRAPTFFADWEKVADDCVAVLHAEAGRHPYDRDLSDLIGELSTRSEPFRIRWARHDVRYHDTGRKRFHHPVVGELELAYEVMKLAADDELTMFVYTTEPGSRSADSLNLLASWAATAEQAEREAVRRPEWESTSET